MLPMQEQNYTYQQLHQAFHDYLMGKLEDIVEQKQKAIDYFQEHKKLFVAWVNFPHILLYMGATEDIYIRSSLCKEVDADEIVKVMEQVGHWYRFYGVE